MLRWMWDMYGMFSLMKLLMWDLPFMSLKFSYYMFKYTIIVMYYVMKACYEMFKLFYGFIKFLVSIF